MAITPSADATGLFQAHPLVVRLFAKNRQVSS